MRFTPIMPRFGARVHDFDLQRGGTPDEIRQLRAAYDEYGLLLFRGGPRISPERHLEIANWFGPPGAIGDGDRLVTVLDNKEPSGSFRLPFHSDLTYTEEPVKFIALHAIELPENPTSTTYVSGVDAWATLPEALRDEVAGLASRHYYPTSIQIEDFPFLAQEWPVRLIHPRTGKPILFVTQWHTDSIVGMDEAEGKALIQALFDHIYAPEAQYEHVWELHDLVLWDNLAMQHSRTQHADRGKGNRLLQRVNLSESSYLELIERARQKQAA